jgi:hypothetical protein
MKTIAVFCLLASAPALHAQSTSQVPQHVNVTVNSEATDLARGFAEAYAALSHTPVSLGIMREGTLRVLDDVRGVKSSKGVIIVEVGRGLTYILNPKDVVFITDGPAPKPKS